MILTMLPSSFRKASRKYAGIRASFATSHWHGRFEARRDVYLHSARMVSAVIGSYLRLARKPCSRPFGINFLGKISEDAFLSLGNAMPARQRRRKEVTIYFPPSLVYRAPGLGLHSPAKR